ncbi:MAG: methionine synthase [Bacteroidaceae bacterium]
MTTQSLREAIKERVLCLDGAMGTMIQRAFATDDAPIDMNHNGNMDSLNITHPDMITSIHKAYLEAGADIIETNTFNAQRISQADYHLEHKVIEFNRAAVALARAAADEYTAHNPAKPRYVVGGIGPTNKTASISSNVEDVAARSITWDELVDAYYEQCLALIEAGVDALLVETTFDTLNAKAALYAAQQAMEEAGKNVELMLSITLTESGRTLSGQTVDAMLASIQHIPLLSLGFNCSFGADQMVPYVRDLAQKSPFAVSVYPNAGLPNELGEYAQSAQMMNDQLQPLFEEKLVNIVGGCCGTTEAHIALIAKACQKAIPHIAPPRNQYMTLAGLEPLPITPERNMTHIGERCNVAGSRKFLRLINEKKYDEAASIARKQVDDGALIIDINMDDGLLDAKKEMVHFIRTLVADPNIACRPWMIDSSDWSVLEAALHEIQGKPIVNSISLKEGEILFIEHAQILKRLGAAVVVMAFDEKGQADTKDRKIEVCQRAYTILTEKVGFPAEDIVFDPNVLAIATGIETHRRYALDFIEATAWIHTHLPKVHISGGISNLSFSFRGNNYLREAMHAVFLYHAIKVGLDMAIVNPSTQVLYNDIPQDLLEALEDLMLRPSENHEERVIEIAKGMLDKSNPKTPQKSTQNVWRQGTVEERLGYALLHGESEFLQEDLAEAIKQYPKAVNIIEGPLMMGMKEVGNRFATGLMFLPQVVKTARTMKQAVAILQPNIEAEKVKNTSQKKILLATVKGDVHDIGKNIVGIVMACAGYEVLDLGVMVPPEKIIDTAIQEKVCIIGLSGLITPSLQEMVNVVSLAEKKGLTIPILIGGATTSLLHTALKIKPFYSGPTIYSRDASQNVQIVSKILDPKQKEIYLNSLQHKYDEVVEDYTRKQETDDLVPFEQVKHKK